MQAGRSGAGATRARYRCRAAEAHRRPHDRNALRADRGECRAQRRHGAARMHSPPRSASASRVEPPAWKKQSEIGNEVETLYTNGPAGGGGAWKQAKQVVAVVSTLIPQDRVRPQSASRWPEMKLRELAHARTGDKGDTSQISVIAYEPGDFAYLAEHVTVDRVREHFAAVVRGGGEALRAARPRCAELRDGERARGRRHAFSVAGCAR